MASLGLKIVREPPLRLVVKALCGVLPVKASTRSLWDVSARPNYLAGLLLAARQARDEGVPEIAAIEFGVAGGNGLVVLEREAAAIAAETGVNIKVYGFDNGPGGLPAFIGDHRDHPDAWQPGDYPMDEAKLRARLMPTTTLVLGNVRETVPAMRETLPPLGFLSVDVDMYSSTVDVLKIFDGARMLHRTFIYFDDVDMPFSHRYAGELLAIDEFNRDHETIKIDRLHGFNIDRPFPEKEYLRMMYVAHDLAAISNARAEAGRKPLMTHVLR